MFGYVAPLPAEIEGRVAQILGTLVRLSFRRRAAQRWSRAPG